MNRNLELTERAENIRNQQVSRHIIQFNLQEIKNRFDESIKEVKQKFYLFDELLLSNKIDEAQDILRTQIVFVESILDFFLHEMTKYSYYKMFLNE